MAVTTVVTWVAVTWVAATTVEVVTAMVDKSTGILQATPGGTLAQARCYSGLFTHMHALIPVQLSYFLKDGENIKLIQYNYKNYITHTSLIQESI
jgi:hypothetical protein